MAWKPRAVLIGRRVASSVRMVKPGRRHAGSAIGHWPQSLELSPSMKLVSAVFWLFSLAIAVSMARNCFW